LGMKVVAHDPFLTEALVEIDIHGHSPVRVKIETRELDKVLEEADFLTLHVPGGEMITEQQFNIMKNGVCIANASRGGVINEHDLIAALNSGKVAHAALDVFVNEPTPMKEILTHEKISLTPHIGAATEEAQERIGIELAEKIITALNE
jgi:D-3-phosphoglycerate dehydrogenase